MTAPIDHIEDPEYRAKALSTAAIISDDIIALSNELLVQIVVHTPSYDESIEEQARDAMVTLLVQLLRNRRDTFRRVIDAMDEGGIKPILGASVH